MKKFIIFFSLFTCFLFAQNEQLANNYFDKGDFEKALLSYEELLKTQPNNYNYFQRQVECLQQLSQFEKAGKAIESRLNTYKIPTLLIDLGFNYQLQKNEDKAKKYYNQAIESIKDNVNYVYSVAGLFEKKVLLDYALLSYQTATAKNPALVFNYQMAIIYGQQGNTDKMIESFLTEAETNPQSSLLIQNQLSRFMQEDANGTFVEMLKKALLLRAQKSTEIFWNQYLSWFYVQQREYKKAFIQEKAIYKRNPETFDNIVNLSYLANQENDTETATEILTFVLENTNDIALKIHSNHELMEIKIKKSTSADLPLIKTDFENLFVQYGKTANTLTLQILYAHFLAFYQKNTEEAKKILQHSLTLPINKYQIADVKMELADVLLLEEKFNLALINYAQIQEDLAQDEVGNEANLKGAKTSYFKGDFEWALKQFQVLKSASSQLIANDALELFLLINDNKVADSTYVALKKFARGDFLLYQNRNKEALLIFESIIKENKGNEIEPATYLRLGRLYEQEGDFETALSNYQKIIDNFKDCIYADEALYYAANIYLQQKKDATKAKQLYEKLIFEHEDSIYFVDARIRFRQIRGDKEI